MPVCPGAHVNHTSTQSGTTALHVACEGGHERVASVLLTNEADIDAVRTSDFFTPLMCAAAFGHEEGLAQAMSGHWFVKTLRRQAQRVCILNLAEKMNAYRADVFGAEQVLEVK